MDVYEAVTGRRAGGSNIQPWNIYVLTGPPLAELKTRAVERRLRSEADIQRAVLKFSVPDL